MRCRLYSSVMAVVVVAACGGSQAPAGGASGATPPPASSSSPTTSDACAMLTPAEIASAVGNPVQPGAPFAGQEVCKWETEAPGHVDVLLTVRLMGGIRAKPLCDGLPSATDKGARIGGVGDLAFWKFSSNPLFNSGDLELCTAKGFVALSLNGKADETRLQSAALALAKQVLQRM
jgi:hypothetical protein